VVNQVEEVDKVACYSLRQAPSRRKSEMQKMSSKQTSLLRVDIKSPSVDASQDETSVQRSWRLNSEQFIDSITLIAAAKRKSMLKEKQLKLKQRISGIYDCIKRGERTIMKKIHGPDQSGWERIQEEMRENVISMNNIMEELQMIGLEKHPRGTQSTSTSNQARKN
jgi:hypothetical protein